MALWLGLVGQSVSIANRHALVMTAELARGSSHCVCGMAGSKDVPRTGALRELQLRRDAAGWDEDTVLCVVCAVM